MIIADALDIGGRKCARDRQFPVIKIAHGHLVDDTDLMQSGSRGMNRLKSF
jgi:hypothetical protein